MLVILIILTNFIQERKTYVIRNINLFLNSLQRCDCLIKRVSKKEEREGRRNRDTNGQLKGLRQM
jgi:hypothetical protein